MNKNLKKMPIIYQKSQFSVFLLGFKNEYVIGFDSLTMINALTLIKTLQKIFTWGVAVSVRRRMNKNFKKMPIIYQESKFSVVLLGF